MIAIRLFSASAAPHLDTGRTEHDVNAEWIDAIYREHFLGTPFEQRHGWSFMYTPEARLGTAKVMLVGLNPGGDQVTDDGRWDVTAGNAYVDEPWGHAGALNPLQRQIQAMFTAMGIDPLTEVFAAQLVPFRSPSWNALPNREAAVTRCLELWQWVLRQSSARLFLSLGKRPGHEIAKLLGAEPQAPHPVGWGPQRIDEYVAGDGRVVLAMPHLSRFQLFATGRPEAADVVGRAAARALTTR